MNRLFLKRTFRILKKNAGRYGSLFFLCAMAMFLVVGIVSASVAVIDTEEQKALETRLEDGFFETFVPLDQSQIDELEKVAEIEEKESLDFRMTQGAKIRIYPERQSMDKVFVEQGEMAQEEDEVVLDKNCALYMDLHPGDTVSFAGREWKVSGTGVAMDYGNVLENLSDLNSNPRIFTVAFVSEAAFQNLKQSQKALQAPGIEYAFRMKDGAGALALKKKLDSMKTPLSSIEDPLFLELADPDGKQAELEKISQKKEEILSALESLDHANDQLSESFGMLDQGIQPYAGKIPGLSSGLQAVADGFDQTHQGYEELYGEVRPFLEDLNNLDAGIEIPVLRQFVEAQDNPRIKAASVDVQMNLNVGLLAGIVLTVLIAYVISIFIAHIIDKESSTLGTWMALGYTRSELMRQYIWIPVIITFAGSLLGTILGCLPFFQHLFIQGDLEYYSVPDPQSIIPGFLLAYALVLPAVISAFVVWLALKNRLQKPALDLIHGRSRQSRRVNIQVKDSFVSNFQHRQIKKEKGSLAALLSGIFFSLLLLALCLNCYYLCTNLNQNVIKDVQYEYQYSYKYPEYPPLDQKNQAYAQEVKTEILGTQVPFTLLGITDDSEYFPQLPETGIDECVLSLSASQKLGKKAGDLVEFTDSRDQTHSFRIKEVVDYETGLFVFTDIENMRQLFDQPQDYYNVLFSDHALRIDPDRLYSTTSRNDLITSSEIFIGLMSTMIYTLCAAAAMIFVVILYQLCRILLEKNSENIALMKILGYNTREIRKLYLNGSFYVLAAALPFLIVLAKLVMDSLYPYFISNINSGLPMTWDWQVYVAIYLFVLLFYLGVEAWMSRKIEKMDYTALLKKRE